MARRSVRAWKSSVQPPFSESSPNALPLSPSQLRELWDFDNKCGSEIMGAPLRSCSCTESEENFQEYPPMPKTELDLRKDLIKKMWINAKSIFEIFFDPKSPHLGHRMRVRKDLPIRVTLRMQDNYYFGWCSYAPETSPCSHLYARSPVEPRGYMGGPASYCNWVANGQTISLTRPTKGDARYFVRLECKNLSCGQELVWNYGFPKMQPVDSDWFKQCCAVTENTVSRLQDRRRQLCEFMYAERCVLCGFAFSTNNKKRRVQRKPHFINSHADYLGSSWDGLGRYLQEEVNSAQVLTEADLLNGLLRSLTKDLNWTVLPACIVMSREKASFADPGALLQEFKKRCAQFKDLGILVMRGMEEATSIENLSVGHLQPITKSVWRNLNWKDNALPVQGIYSAQSEDYTSSDLQSLILTFCTRNLSKPDQESL